MTRATIFLFLSLASVVAGIFYVSSRTASTAGTSRRRAVFIAGLVGGTIAAAALALAHEGFFAHFDTVPPRIAIFVVVTTVAVQALLPRRVVAAIPLRALVALQAFRILVELGLHALAQERLVPERMTFTGQKFDIAVGLSAPLVALVWYRFGTHWRRVVLVWNACSLAMLGNVVFIAMTAMPGATHLRDEVAPLIVTRVPFILLPAILVGAALAAHVVVFRALLGESGALQPGADTKTTRAAVPSRKST